LAVTVQNVVPFLCDCVTNIFSLFNLFSHLLVPPFHCARSDNSEEPPPEGGGGGGDRTDADIDSNWEEAIETFDAMELPEELLRGIYAYGFEKPSAIQQRAIKPTILGRDLIAQAQSGTVRFYPMIVFRQFCGGFGMLWQFVGMRLPCGEEEEEKNCRDTTQ
jgi:hypothetical protein